MRPSLQLRLGQQLTLTPQLRQALRLLQLSSVDLRQTLLDALESNVMLESVDIADSEETSSTRAEEDAPTESTPVETDWDMPESTVADSSGSRSPEHRYEAPAQTGESLQDYLAWQLDLCHLSPTDSLIALAIIDALDEDGYLSESLEAVTADLVNSEEVSKEEITAVLHRIQSFDPVGVGARDLGECLQLQLRQIDEDTAGLEAARQLVEQREYLEMLGKQQYDSLQRLLRLDETSLQEAIQLIQSLNPRPGAQIALNRTEYVIPDVLVSKRDGHWVVELNPEVSPKLRVNPLYASCVDKQRGAAGSDIRQQLQEARWLIRSLSMRNETLLRVTTRIVECQRDFLEKGEEAMRPLALKDIAEHLEMHESTISRVTSQKYMATPRGTFELRYFFSSHVNTEDGEGASSTAIRAMIRKLIAAENPGKPLSDGRITRELAARGIMVARRTVAKYREAMTIPSSHARKRVN